jgi:cytochrome c
VQRRVSKLVLLGSMAISAFAQSTPQQQTPIRPVDGATIFRNNCAACHGLQGRGDVVATIELGCGSIGIEPPIE